MSLGGPGENCFLCLSQAARACGAVPLLSAGDSLALPHRRGQAGGSAPPSAPPSTTRVEGRFRGLKPRGEADTLSRCNTLAIKMIH